MSGESAIRFIDLKRKERVDMKRNKLVKDIAGNRYGRLRAVKFAGTDKTGNAVWDCKCDCGNTHIVRAAKLKTGNTKSCGCLRQEMVYDYEPSKIIIEGDLAKIELRDIEGNVTGYALVDKEDYDKVKDIRWALYGNYVAGRVTKNNENRTYLHRFLLNPTKPHVDHANANRLDNRRSNLRECDHAQNFHNQEKRKIYAGRPTTSKYKGVHVVKKSGKYVAQIAIPSGRINLGTFDNEDDAGLAYNEMALKHFGEFARINKIEGGE